MTTSPERDLQIAILGAGPGGMCMAIRLRNAGFHNIDIYEKSDGVGGTWHHNRYPGCAVDIQSAVYSYSFEIKHDWSRPYAPQTELLAYMRQCAEKYGLLPLCHFNDAVTAATWNEDSARWSLDFASGGQAAADVVVSAIGMFNEISYPDIAGIERFRGTRFHSARWDWSHDIDGETVGVIGSAASAVQFVPEIVKAAGQVHLFQRTANWVLPKEDDPYTEDEIGVFLADPGLMHTKRKEIFDTIDNGDAFSNAKVRADREAIVHGLIDRVEDPEVRENLRPNHPWGCKRPLFSNDYYPAFNRPNLELVTEPIDRITDHGIRTADGRDRTIDTLIFASGFRTTRYLSAIDVTGRDGVHIADAWNDGAQAYLGVTTSGFPNLFMLYGPNTNNGSIITMIEYQVDHAVQLIERIADEGLAWLDVKPEAEAAYNDEIQADLDQVEVWHASCSSYYRSPSGRIVTQWPHSMTNYADRVIELDVEAFEVAAR